MNIQLPAIFNKITSMADKSYKLEFVTRELGSDAATLMTLIHQEGWLLLSLNKQQETDIPTEKADSMTNQKTQAQRLRSVLFILWKQKGADGDFEQYYRTHLEQIIDQIKSKIE